MNFHVKASFMAVEGGPVNHDLGCLAELEIACILYRFVISPKTGTAQGLKNVESYP